MLGSSAVTSSPFFLTTRRLGFRVWTDDDLELALDLWGDPDVARLIRAGGPPPSEEIASRLNREIANQRDLGIQYWPIFLLAGGVHAGCAGLRPYRSEVPEFGVHLHRAYWGQGVAVEAATAVIRYAFETLGASALFAGHNPANIASRGLLAKLGFRHTHDELYAPTGLLHPSYLLERRAMPSTG
jgi:[ribosomal protein S5]-alanine N-acetyltransferase